MKKGLLFLVIIILISMSIPVFCTEADNKAGTSGDAVNDKVEEKAPELIKPVDKLVRKTVYVYEKLPEKNGTDSKKQIVYKFKLNDYVIIEEEKKNIVPTFRILNEDELGGGICDIGRNGTDYILYITPDSYGEMSVKIRAALSEADFTEFELQLKFLKPGAETRKYLWFLIFSLMLLVFIYFGIVKRKSASFHIVDTDGNRIKGLAFETGGKKYIITGSKVKLKNIRTGEEFYCRYFPVPNAVQDAEYAIMGKDGKKQIFYSDQY